MWIVSYHTLNRLLTRFEGAHCAQWDSNFAFKDLNNVSETEDREFCSHIEDFTNTTAYDDIEKKVASFNGIISWAEHFVPILLAFYIGSWSDHWGRKPFLAVCMLGRVIGAGFSLLNAVYLDEWNRWRRFYKSFIVTIQVQVKNPSLKYKVRTLKDFFFSEFQAKKC